MINFSEGIRAYTGYRANLVLTNTGIQDRSVSQMTTDNPILQAIRNPRYQFEVVNQDEEGVNLRLTEGEKIMFYLPWHNILFLSHVSEAGLKAVA